MVNQLENLIKILPQAVLRGSFAGELKSVTSDSRQAGPGVVFVAVIGTAANGHQYLNQAVEAGSEVLVHQSDLDDFLSPENRAKLSASVCMNDTRPAPALLARQLNDCPDDRLLTAAVTGTNGKTTVSYLLKEMLDRLHGPCGLIGTICYDDGNGHHPAPLTTPGGPVFYHWLQRMVQSGCQSVAMELSSHALDQQRTAGLDLSVAVMTNIGRDHLDYHQDMDSYVHSKSKIISMLKPGAKAVINSADDALFAIPIPRKSVIYFDPRPNKRSDSFPDLVLLEASLQLSGTRLTLDYQGGIHFLKSPLVGRFNVENLMAAFCAGVALGFEPSKIIAALAGVQQVPGRLEQFALPNGALAVVDYAHTHDALAAVLRACDEVSDGRLLVVAGCGGDRDRGKRPLMGAVAAQEADATWITSDNPRSEDPAVICQEIVEGYQDVHDPRSKELEVIVDRRQAIVSALESAREFDVVVVAGKGHEDYQLVKDEVLKLDDRQIIRDWIGAQGSDFK